MQKADNWDDEARRVRILRRAIMKTDDSQQAFAEKMGWHQSETSQFESGSRMVPRSKVLKIHHRVPGLDPLWLTEGKLDNIPLPLTGIHLVHFQCLRLQPDLPTAICQE